jgi:hypothetical protein
MESGLFDEKHEAKNRSCEHETHASHKQRNVAEQDIDELWRLGTNSIAIQYPNCISAIDESDQVKFSFRTACDAGSARICW